MAGLIQQKDQKDRNNVDESLSLVNKICIATERNVPQNMDYSLIYTVMIGHDGMQEDLVWNLFVKTTERIRQNTYRMDQKPFFSCR